MLTSCADHGGQYGNQLWFSFKSRFQIVTWRTVSHRIMFAVLTRSRIAYAFVVAHGPTEAATPDTKRKWWELLDTTVREIKKKYPDAPLAILGDMNARVGSGLSNAVGPVAPQTENRNGELLRTMADNNSLSLVNTFLPGAEQTWCSSRGLWHRIDYIIVPRCQLHRVKWCATLPNVDLAMSVSADHLLVAAEWAPDCKKFVSKPPDKKLRIGKRKLADERCVDSFQQCLWRDVPTIDPEQHIDDQLEQVKRPSP